MRTFVGASGGFYPISMWCWNGVAIYRLFVPLDCVRAEQVMQRGSIQIHRKFEYEGLVG